MSDGIAPTERLDLRFRTADGRQRRSWLPGSTWLWFGLGLLAGAIGWQYGHHLLASQLSQRLLPNSHPGEAILALEALDMLESDDQAHFVRGLIHPDIRVARSAMQKLLQRMDGWSQLESTQYYAELRTLGHLLDQVPVDMSEENRTLIRSLAARLYSTCVSINDPQLQPVTRISQRLLSLGTTAATQQSPYSNTLAVRTVPPEPLQRITNAASFTTSDNDFSEYQLSDDQFEAPKVITSAVPSMTSMSDHRTADIRSAVHSERPQPPPELPVLVSTPASIASQPVVRMKLVSNQPNLQGIEKAEIAELVRLLASEQADVSKGAALALRHRGFTDSEIELASELAIGTAARRIELIQQIARSSQMSPQPWLVWMAEDGQPEVRRMSISLLSSMQTEDVQRSLRMLLFRETDQEIRDMIRKVLLSKSTR